MNLGKLNQPKERNLDINHDRIQYRVAKDLIKDKDLDGLNVLDYGCGNGEFSVYLRSLGANVEVFEPDRDSRKAINDFNLKRVEELGEYDYIFMLDVIEHIVEPEPILKKLQSHLKDGGIIIITTPDCNYWKYRIKHLLGDISLIAYPHKHFVFFERNNLKTTCDKYFHTIKVKNYPYTLGYMGVIK